MELSKTKLSLYATLGSAKMRRRHGLFVAEGEKLVADTRSAFKAEALVAGRRWLGAHPEALGFAAEVVREASEADIKKISCMSTAPEVMAVYRIPEENEMSHAELIEEARRGPVLVLDGIQDPGNLGTIVRTADWFGIYRIVASRDTADIYNAKAVQATMGAVSRVKITYTDLPVLLGKAAGVPVYGTLLEGKNIYGQELGQDGFIVMGNEGKGISPQVRPLIDRPLLIPPYGGGGHGESLNVAAATAITLALFRAGH